MGIVVGRKRAIGVELLRMASAAASVIGSEPHVSQLPGALRR
jgi:hypothetical protein